MVSNFHAEKIIQARVWATRGLLLLYLLVPTSPKILSVKLGVEKSKSFMHPDTKLFVVLGTYTGIMTAVHVLICANDDGALVNPFLCSLCLAFSALKNRFFCHVLC